MSKKIVEINDLSFAYGQNKVLDNVKLCINEGDFVGIVGQNGSAKSTLLKLMLGILKPQSGTMKLFGENIKDFEEWGKIGYISQNVREFNTKFPATVEEIIGANLYSKLGFFKFLNKNHKDEICKALDIVNMCEYKDRLIGNLSGGQKQKVFIARALINNPKIIFMDEPLVGVDIKSQEEFYELMELLNKKYGITLVMVSHDIGIISKKVNKVFCLGNGKVYIHDQESLNDSKCVEKFFGKNIKILRHEH